jgi:hypothetical protein
MVDDTANRIERTSRSERLASRRLVVMACVIIAFVAIVIQTYLPPPSDVSFFVLSAEKILNGARPYVDILETNPPLAFWLTIPAVWAGHLLLLPPQVAFLFYVCLLVFASLWLMRRVCDSAGQARAESNFLLIVSAGILLLLPISSFGQREHLATVLLFPYVAAQMQRVEGRAVPPALRFAIGLMAGVGVAFKPYFLAIPGLVELYLLWCIRDWRLPLRADVIGLALPVALFPFLVWTFTPQYFSDIVPLALQTYPAFAAALWQVVLCVSVPALLPILLWTGYTAATARDRGLLVWVAAAAGAYLAYVLQAKGWEYQMLPALALAGVPFISMMASAPLSRARFILMVMAGATILIGSTLREWKTLDQTKALDEHLAGLPGGRLMVFSWDIGVTFPYVGLRAMSWADSYPGLWMLPAINKDALSEDQKRAVIQTATAIVVNDLDRYQPDYVLVDRRSNSEITGQKELKYLELFQMSEAFRQRWSNYRLVRESPSLQVWARQP